MTGPSGLIVQIVGGSLIGVATGLFGVGLASLSVVFFILLFRLDMKTVLGTSLLASFFRYAGGSMGYLTALQINPLMFGILVAGGGFGSIAGARIILGSGKAGDRGFKDSYVKLLQVGVLLFISYEFLLKSLIFGH